MKSRDDQVVSQFNVRGDEHRRESTAESEKFSKEARLTALLRPVCILLSEAETESAPRRVSVVLGGDFDSLEAAWFVQRLAEEYGLEARFDSQGRNPIVTFAVIPSALTSR